MILGLSSPLTHASPTDWARQHKELGCDAIVFPYSSDMPSEIIDSYVDAAKQEDLTIAEVGVWRNTLSSNPRERDINISYAIDQLRLADRIGANCCVNIVGTPHGPVWDGAYVGNYSKETWEMAVKMIQFIIDEATPIHTKFTIEPMPWMIPSSPDEYLKLIEDVNRDAFGVHMDLINMINSPKRYFFHEEFAEECFEKLGDKICSCHLKNVILLPEYTFQLRECACEDGAINLRYYASLATKANPRMPMIIEHLDSDEEYLRSLSYIKTNLKDFIYR